MKKTAPKATLRENHKLPGIKDKGRISIIGSQPPKNKIADNELRDKDYSIVVVAEGAVTKDGQVFNKGHGEMGRDEVILGGVGEWVASEVRKRTNKDSRSLVLGHLQRGGSPTTFDRLLALRFGAAAVRMAEEGLFGQMVAWTPPTMSSVLLEDAIRRRKQVDLESDKVLTARSIGICLGDRE